MTDETGRTPAYERAEQLLGPMLVLSILLLPVLLLPAVWPGMPRTFRDTLTVADRIRRCQHHRLRRRCLVGDDDADDDEYPRATPHARSTWTLHGRGRPTGSDLLPDRCP